MSDAEMVAAVRAGDGRAFAQLVARHFPACLRYARHLLGDAMEAEDVVQETFVRAFRGLGRYRERDTFHAWLFRILVNRCRSAAGRRRRRNARVVPDPRAVEEAGSPDPAARADLGRRLERALVGLDARHREAFLLRVGEELDYDAIARLTGASVPALRMRVKRARDHVRACWREVEDA